MFSILRLLLSFIFLFLSALHFYWAFGGEWGLDGTVPTNTEGKKILRTSVLSCIVVGTGLMVFALYYFIPILEISILEPLYFLSWLIPAIFLIRSIGDFKYVGFFKKIKSTRFSQLDTKYFSPLCLLLAILGFSIILI